MKKKETFLGCETKQDIIINKFCNKHSCEFKAKYYDDYGGLVVDFDRFIFEYKTIKHDIETDQPIVNIGYYYQELRKENEILYDDFCTKLKQKRGHYKHGQHEKAKKRSSKPAPNKRKRIPSN